MTASHARACPACGHRGAHLAAASAGREQLRCDDCGSVFSAEVPASSAPAQGEPGGEARRRAVADARAAILRKFGCRAVLEIECGAGLFLDAVRELGLQVEGIAAAPDLAALARGHVIHTGAAAGPGARFDAVALWDLLDRVPDPRGMLLQARRRLRPGGFLALSTRAPGRELVDPAPAICFSRRGLRLLLAATCYDPVRWTSGPAPGREPLQGPGRGWFGASLPGRALAQGLAIAARLPSRVFDRAGLGSSFEVYAVAGRA